MPLTRLSSSYIALTFLWLIVFSMESCWFCPFFWSLSTSTCFCINFFRCSFSFLLISVSCQRYCGIKKRIIIIFSIMVFVAYAKLILSIKVIQLQIKHWYMRSSIQNLVNITKINSPTKLDQVLKECNSPSHIHCPSW